MNELTMRRRQKGVFAIEFALGFLVLFMFTMLIFETCRLTYICSVLDYATAEAARDSRVQLRKNPSFNKYRNPNFSCTDPSLSEEEQKECKLIKSFNGDEFKVWFYTFIDKNGGTLWDVLSARGAMSIDASHYKTRADLTADTPRQSKTWQKNAFTLYEVQYHYKPVFFAVPGGDKIIKRHVLVTDEFERHQSVKNEK
ncbi:TadE/TadG family type IV pilus assembly protein [Vibrio europaeus]|uniref:TadE/TadG family type IV pilus assembly protein n=1 Tax=Vibrio europaeus TaxID=300876 RepID=UPI0039E1580B